MFSLVLIICVVLTHETLEGTHENFNHALSALNPLVPFPLRHLQRTPTSKILIIFVFSFTKSLLAQSITDKIMKQQCLEETIYVREPQRYTQNIFVGTGVVTSVPSDSPDDFTALRDLKSKEVLILHIVNHCLQYHRGILDCRETLIHEPCIFRIVNELFTSGDEIQTICLVSNRPRIVNVYSFLFSYDCVIRTLPTGYAI